MLAARKRKGVAKKPRATVARGRQSNLAMEKMSAEASKTLEEHSAAIAEAMAKSAMKGSAAGTRMLVALAAGQFCVEEKQEKRRTRSLASALAAEPEWKDEGAEATV